MNFGMLLLKITIQKNFKINISTIAMSKASNKNNFHPSTSFARVIFLSLFFFLFMKIKNAINEEVLTLRT